MRSTMTQLVMFVKVLRAIFLHPEDQDAEAVPAKKWLER
jgi:hypothetical protein